MSGLRLIVDAPIENLRERLEGAYFGFFSSVEFPPEMDLDDVQDLVELVPFGSSRPLDLSGLLKESASLIGWLETAQEDTFTSVDQEAALHPVNMALLLFSPGVPCISLSQIKDLTIELIEFRSSHPAFSGVLTFAAPHPDELLLSWDLGIEFARLQVDFKSRSGVIAHSSPDGKETFEILSERRG